MRTGFFAFLIFLSGIGVARADVELEQGWKAFMKGLANAHESLTDPEDFPPKPTDRNLAEGHRYLRGQGAAHGHFPDDHLHPRHHG